MELAQIKWISEDPEYYFVIRYCRNFSKNMIIQPLYQKRDRKWVLLKFHQTPICAHRIKLIVFFTFMFQCASTMFITCTASRLLGDSQTAHFSNHNSSSCLFFPSLSTTTRSVLYKQIYLQWSEDYKNTTSWSLVAAVKLLCAVFIVHSLRVMTWHASNKSNQDFS